MKNGESQALVDRTGLKRSQVRINPALAVTGGLGTLCALLAQSEETFLNATVADRGSRERSVAVTDKLCLSVHTHQSRDALCI